MNERLSPPPPPSESAPVEIECLAAPIGAADVFVLHAITQGHLVNLDGVGRGANWAGNLAINSDEEPWLAAAAGSPLRHRGEQQRLFGPFWSAEAVQVPVGDYLVVFSGDGVCRHDDDHLIGVASSVAWSVGAVPTGKRLADELELSQAALAIASIDSSGLEDAARALATQAATLLSCEFAVVYLTDPPQVVFGDGSLRTDVSPAEMYAAIEDFVADSVAVVVDQEVRASPLALRPLALDDGLVARCAIPLGADAQLGWLCCAHTIDHPRGFTSLCQLVAAAIGDHGSRVLARTVGAST